MADKFIQSAIRKPGSLRAELGTPKGQTIPKTTLKAAAAKPGKEGERARFAMTLAKMGDKKAAPKKPTMTKAQDMAADRKAGITPGSKQDQALDKKRGVKDGY